MMNNIFNKYYTYIIFILLFGSGVLVIWRSCILNDIANEILIGMFVSSIFYLIVVYIPSLIYKKNHKRVFLKSYDNFKNDVLREMLILSGYNASEPNWTKKIEELKDAKKFTDYFNKPSLKKGQTNWHVLLNNINNVRYADSINEIVICTNQLRSDLSFLLGSIQVHDDKLLSGFRRIDHALSNRYFRVKLDGSKKEDERFAESLYELLSGRSITGSESVDFIKKWVKKL